MESTRTLDKMMMISEIEKVKETHGECQGMTAKNTIAARPENH